MSADRDNVLQEILRTWSFDQRREENDLLPSPSLRQRLYRRWIAFARVLGKINTVLLLSLFYFLVIGPFAFVFRLIGKDLLDRGHEQCDSYWYDREEEEHTLERQSRQF